MEMPVAAPARRRADGAGPYYQPVGNEVEVFTAAFRSRRAIMLTGPTGCGKTRFVEAMAHQLGLDLHTVSCHEDLSASDLLGRYLLKAGETVWVDGPLTRAARDGGICYLDEIVEARQDATVVVHSVADHRRELNLERHGAERIVAHPDFCLVVSFNPGYQSVLKDLKVSTRQRMVTVRFGFPPAEAEHEVVVRETGVGADEAWTLVSFAHAVRRLEHGRLREAASTRTVVAAAALTSQGMSTFDAGMAAMVRPMTDDANEEAALAVMLETYTARR